MERGRAAEEAAAAYLREQGYAVAERNWRCRAGELDIVAVHGDTLVFVEVRSMRQRSRFGTAVEAVTPRKIRQVRELAVHYIRQRRPAQQRYRFDAVAVTFGEGEAIAELKHLPNAF